jgi:hypothetical protein
MEVSGQLHTPAALTQEKSPWYPLDRRLGGSQSRSGHGGDQKNSQPLPLTRTPNHSAYSSALHHCAIVSPLKLPAEFQGLDDWYNNNNNNNNNNNKEHYFLNTLFFFFGNSSEAAGA